MSHITHILLMVRIIVCQTSMTTSMKKCESQTCHDVGFKSEMSYTKFVIRVETVLPTLGGWLLNLRMQI